MLYIHNFRFIQKVAFSVPSRVFVFRGAEQELGEGREPEIISLFGGGFFLI